MKTIEEEERALLSLAEEAYQAGNPILAGMLRVEAGNTKFRRSMKPIHKPSLGPYSANNPNVCLKCGQSLEDVPLEAKCEGLRDDLNGLIL